MIDVLLIIFGALNLLLVPVGIIKKKYGVTLLNAFAAAFCLFALIYNK